MTPRRACHPPRPRLHRPRARGPRRTLPSLSADPLAFLLVEGDAGFLLGRAVAGEAELLTIAVAPEARRLGLGRKLVGAVSLSGALARGGKRLSGGGRGQRRRARASTVPRASPMPVDGAATTGRPRAKPSTRWSLCGRCRNGRPPPQPDRTVKIHNLLRGISLDRVKRLTATSLAVPEPTLAPRTGAKVRPKLAPQTTTTDREHPMTFMKTLLGASAMRPDRWRCPCRACNHLRSGWQVRQILQRSRLQRRNQMGQRNRRHLQGTGDAVRSPA